MALKDTTDPSGDIFRLLEAELLRRLTEGPCEACGRTAASLQELDLARRWLNDHGYLRAPSAYPQGEDKRPKMPRKFVDPDNIRTLKEAIGN